MRVARSKASEFYRKYSRNRSISGTMKQLALDFANLPLPTLDNFIVGRNAELLVNLKRFVAREAGERFHYVWGRPGSGRSHLLKGVTTELQRVGTAAAIVVSRKYASVRPPIRPSRRTSPPRRPGPARRRPGRGPCLVRAGDRLAGRRGAVGLRRARRRGSPR